jgi:hypothetical protein
MNLHVIRLFSFSLLPFHPPRVLFSSNNAKDVTDIIQSEMALIMKISEKSTRYAILYDARSLMTMITITIRNN